MRMFNPEWEAIRHSGLCAASVDLAFALEGRRLPLDHAQPLLEGIRKHLPWLGTHPGAGIHAIAGAPSGETGGDIVINRRTRLLLRVPRGEAARAEALCGAELSIDGNALRIGAAQIRELLPHATLYAHRVDLEAADEAIFLAAAGAALQKLGIEAGLICGKARKIQAEHGLVQGYSLMIHDVAPEASLRLQDAGLGGHRLLGCGVFIPHKSIKDMTFE